MTYTAPPQGGPADLNPTIKAILSNADRLAEEAIDLGDYGRTFPKAFRTCGVAASYGRSM